MFSFPAGACVAFAVVRWRGGEVMAALQMAVRDAVVAEWDEVVDSVRRFADLEVDWDGEGGAVPARCDVENAVRFLEKVRGVAVTPYWVTPYGCGEVSLVWKRDNGATRMGVTFEEGRVRFYFHRPGGVLEMGEGVDGSVIDDKLIGFVCEWLRR